MPKIVLLVAMPEELATPPAGMVLVHTGVGKINAAWRCATAIAAHRPDLVINFGTAGAVTDGVQGLVEVGASVQRDMDVRALGLPLGATPFDEEGLEIRFSAAPLVCGTGDSFAETRPEMPCDLVDMELYAIAKVCKGAGIALRAFKYVSDKANHAAPSDWRAALRHAESAFLHRMGQGL